MSSKCWIGHQFRRFRWPQIKGQAVSLGDLRIKDVDGLSRGQAVAAQDLFGALFPCAIDASTQKSCFSQGSTLSHLCLGQALLFSHLRSAKKI